jgi:hypothetical protein
MTLVAAFRCRDGGILLCADREENDGYAKKEVDKIYHFSCESPKGSKAICEFFIAGSGPSKTIGKAYIAICNSLRNAAESGVNLATEHKSYIENALTEIHEQDAKILKRWGMNLLVVVAPHIPGNSPQLYRTEKAELCPEALYAAEGNGQIISNYLASRLYTHGLQKPALAALAAFIFREVEYSRVGVGLGLDMWFIHEGDKSRNEIPPIPAAEIQAGVPSLKDAVYSYWERHLVVPDWINIPLAGSGQPGRAN